MDKKVKCLDCARFDREREECKTTARMVTPSSERKCKFYLAKRWKKKAGVKE